MIGDPSYRGPYTWGKDTPRVLFNIGSDRAPVDGSKFPAKDDFDNVWLLVEIGDMVPLTEELLAQKRARPVTVPRAELQNMLADLEVFRANLKALLTAG